MAIVKCVLCLEENSTPYMQLCPECEEFCKRLRRQNGLAIREVPIAPVREEPDD